MNKIEKPLDRLLWKRGNTDQRSVSVVRGDTTTDSTDLKGIREFNEKV